MAVQPDPPDTPAVFHVRDGARLGFRPSQPRRGRFPAPFRGVRAAGDGNSLGASGLSVAQRCEAALLLIPDTAVFSHTTAGLLHGLRLPFRLEHSPGLHVTVPAARQEPRLAGIIGHHCRLLNIDKRTVGDLPLTSPERTWLDLAGLVTDKELVIIGDALIRRNLAPSSLPAIHGYLDRCAGRRHIKRLRAAVDRLRPGTDSAQETRLRLLMDDAGLPVPEINAAVYGSDGSFLGTADMSLPLFRVVLEYEGRHHVTDAEQYVRDIYRYERMQEHGWRVMRFTREDLADRTEETVRRIRRVLHSRGWRPQSPDVPHPPRNC